MAVFFKKKVLITLWCWSFQSDHHITIFSWKQKFSLALKIFQKSFPKCQLVREKQCCQFCFFFYQFGNTARKKDNRPNLLQMHISSRKGKMHKVSDAIIVWRHWCIWIFLLFFACHHLQFKCKIARSLHSKNLFQLPKGNYLFKCRLLCFCKVT